MQDRARHRRRGIGMVWLGFAILATVLSVVKCQSDQRAFDESQQRMNTLHQQQMERYRQETERLIHER